VAAAGGEVVLRGRQLSKAGGIGRTPTGRPLRADDILKV